MQCNSILEVLKEETVILDEIEFNSKEEVFLELSKVLESVGIVKNHLDFVKCLNERENQGSTYMGHMIGLPHGRGKTVNEPGIVFCRVKKPFIYESNGEKGDVKYIFMLAISEDQSNEEYMLVLATLARMLAHHEFIEKLGIIKDYQELVDIVRNFNKGD